MAGFASMAIAKHSALVAFGAVLFLGILVSVLSALFVIPLLVEYFGIDCKPQRR